MPSPLSLTEWLLIGRAAFLVFAFALAAVTFSAWRRAAARQTERSIGHEAEVLKRLDGLDARLVAARNLIAQLTEALERTPRADGGGARTAPGYPIAIRMARSGAAAPELVAACGISQSEAELVCRLHGSPRAASTYREIIPA
ncbi:MAG TPA: DUF2802 domain-containing protein [Steroidobacteraceae bacterium]|nr:DUF2802 domain-containing protein [Candidatus Dormibacteraeota bacterium]HYM26640.1 DUF2802 domain-containing protein [Steroidobacteraceae bacterium]